MTSMTSVVPLLSSTLQLSTVQWYLLLGTLIAVAGFVRLLLTRDLVARLVAMNVVGIGSLLILVSLAARSGPAAGRDEGITDPVLSALVITGLVITVAFTGLGAVLIRRIEGTEHAQGSEGAQDAQAASGADDGGPAQSAEDTEGGGHR